LLEDATTPAAEVAESVYVMERFDEKFLFVMFVTTVWGVVLSVTGPVLVAPGGATTEIVIVTPVGIAELMEATSCFVVPFATLTRYVAVELETPVGALPATAALMISAPGAVVNCTASCASTCGPTKTTSSPVSEAARRNRRAAKILPLTDQVPP
jgi:hypothetical protein